MKTLEVRFAALNRAGEEILKIACHDVSQEGVLVTLRRWDGLPCDVVVLDPRDAYGRLVSERAGRDAVPIIAYICSQTSSRSAYSPRLIFGHSDAADHLVKAIDRALKTRVASNQENAYVPDMPGGHFDDIERAGLVRLSRDGQLKGQDVEASINGRTVWLLPSKGRVLSMSMSDQLSARDRLSSTGWVFRPLKRHSRVPGEFSTSLDAFYMEGALKQAGLLPPYPYTVCSLREWPDLGAAHELIAPLRLIRTLQGGPMTPSALAAHSGLSTDIVSAGLWALSASNLIESDLRGMLPRAPRPATVEKSLLQRLALRFGLA